MRRVKLILAYEGTAYCGWQIQPPHQGLSIQGVLEDRLSRLTGEKIKTVAAGRTDSGVHAWRQVVHLDTRSSIPEDRWPLALNSMLPPDIVAVSSEEVGPEFHARYSAKAKIYRYFFYASRVPNPFLRRYTYQVPPDLSVREMDAAARLLVGTHDFRCFSASGRPVKSYVRTVYWARVRRTGELIWFEICGSGFLYHMVRIIAGTLMEIGRGKMAPQNVNYILKSRDREMAGPTLPPQGLFLWEVIYDGGQLIEKGGGESLELAFLETHGGFAPLSFLGEAKG